MLNFFWECGLNPKHKPFMDAVIPFLKDLINKDTENNDKVSVK